MNNTSNLDFSYISSAPLDSLSQLEWEALCDHCGRCCLVKLEDDETDEVFYTNMICHMYDLKQGQCSCYSERKNKVPGCVDVRQYGNEIYTQLPETCAYRLRFFNMPLPERHPIIAGNNKLMLENNICIKYRAISEEGIHENQFEDHIVSDIK